MSGFTSFTQPPVPVVPTIKEQIVALPGATKNKMLTAYINKSTAHATSIEIAVAFELVDPVFVLVDQLQADSRALMRGEVIITPEVSHIDPATGLKVIDSPAVYNTPPATQGALVTALNDPYLEYFTPGMLTTIVDSMCKWSKYDGIGTFAFYQSQIIL